MFRLEVETSANVIVVRCLGRVVHGDAADSLLNAVMSEDERQILIDLNGVTAIDAAGLGVLARLERWARDQERTLHLVNPSKTVREVLELTELSSTLQILPAKADYHGPSRSR